MPRARKPKPEPQPELTEAQSVLSATDSVPVAQLLTMGAPYNPREIESHEFEALCRSLRFFGCVEPILCNRRTNHIVGGHQRVKAAEAEDFEALPVWWIDLDEPSEMQLNVSLNRVTGKFEESKLRDLIAELEIRGADTSLTGLKADEVSRLMNREGEDVLDASEQLGNVEYRVMVICEDEHDQAELFERMQQEGRKCQLMMV